MQTVAIKIAARETEYLEEIAKKLNLLKNEGQELSQGKALKELLKWCIKNKVDIIQKQNGMDDDLRKMIEQIHLAIPHLMYHARIQTLIETNKCNEQEVELFKKRTFKYMNDTCGDFQNVTYNTIRFSFNSYGMKRLPIDEENTLWK